MLLMTADDEEKSWTNEEKKNCIKNRTKKNKSSCSLIINSVLDEFKIVHFSVDKRGKENRPQIMTWINLWP